MKLTNINLKFKYKLGSLPTPPIGSSASTVNLIGPKFAPQQQGTTRIADQVIEEVDEQLTIQSIRGQEKRPTAQSIFASNNEKIPARSSPIDVPSSHHNNENKISYERIQSVANDHQPYLFPSNEIFSTSAPEENMLHVPSPSVNVVNGGDGSKQASPATGASREAIPSGKYILHWTLFSFVCDNNDFSHLFFFAAEEDVDCTTPTNPMINKTDDHFEQLRLAREKERLERQKQKIARSVSQQTGGSIALDSDLLLEQLINSKGEGINRASFADSNT